MKKKLLALLLAVAVMASLVVLPAQALSAADFTDVPADSWFYEDVDFVTTHGYFIGRGNGIFAPDDMLTREELATILARLDGANLSNNDVSPYADVEAGRWSAAAIQWMSRTGITQGTGNGNFNPTGQLTRQELAVFVARFVEYYTARHNYRLAPKLVVPEFPDLEDADEWAREAIETDRKNGLIYGFQDNCFYPKLTSTRAQIAAIIHRLVVELSIVPTPTTRVVVTYNFNWPAAAGTAPYTTRSTGKTYTPTEPSDPALIPAGYVFAGWNTKADGTGEGRAVNTMYTTNSSLTLYAQWLEATDYIGIAMNKATNQFNAAVAPKLDGAKLLQGNVTVGTEPLVLNTVIDPADTRAQEATASVTLTGDVLAEIIRFATSTAMTLINVDETTARAEIAAYVDAIIDEVEAATDVQLTAFTREDIIASVGQSLGRYAHAFHTNFMEAGKYVARDCVVDADGLTFTFDASSETEAHIAESKHDSVVNLATGLTRQFLANLQSVTSYTDKVDLTAVVTFTFSDSTTYGADTVNFPHVYPYTIHLTLDGNGQLEYKYDSGNYLKINITKATQTQFNNGIAQIVETESSGLVTVPDDYLKATLADMKFSTLGDLLGTPTAAAIASDMFGFIQTLQGIIATVMPADSAVTINGVTIDKASSAAFIGATTPAAATAALSALLKTPGLAELSLSDFAVGSEKTVQATSYGDTHSFKLAIEIQ